MNLATWTVAFLEKQPRPPGYVDDVRACADKVEDDRITIDVDGECYARLREKYKPKPPPIAPKRSRGLGDTVAKAIHRTGRAIGRDIKPCGGCKKRQKLLNKLVPYKQPDDMKDTFDRIVIVNLKRRPERLEETRRQIANCGWPFIEPQVFDAVDASKLPLPPDWPPGGGCEGAYGCMESHRQLLQRAVQDDVQCLLVLEDDVEFRADFGQRVTAFLKDVPDDWQMLMLGGQHFARPQLVKPGVVRVTNTQRTHAYAVRGDAIRELYEHWTNTKGHCDHRLKEFQPTRNVYAPEHQLAGQRPGPSDIAGGTKGSSWWDRQKKPAPAPIEMHTDWFAEMVKGKSVAIVGNGPNANDFDHAQRIDGADVVIRFNRFKLVDEQGKPFVNVGTRTDILAVPIGWTPAIPSDEELARITPKLILACCPPQTPNRPDERDKNYLRLRDKYRIAWLPPEELDRIKHELGKRPTTGLFMLDWLMEKCEPASVYVTGFSFERMKKDHYYNAPFAHGLHDVHREGEYVAKRWEKWAKVLSVDPHMLSKLS